MKCRSCNAVFQDNGSLEVHYQYAHNKASTNNNNNNNNNNSNLNADSTIVIINKNNQSVLIDNNRDSSYCPDITNAADCTQEEAPAHKATTTHNIHQQFSEFTGRQEGAITKSPASSRMTAISPGIAQTPVVHSSSSGGGNGLAGTHHRDRPSTDVNNFSISSAYQHPSIALHHPHQQHDHRNLINYDFPNHTLPPAPYSPTSAADGTSPSSALANDFPRISPHPSINNNDHSINNSNSTMAGSTLPANCHSSVMMYPLASPSSNEHAAASYGGSGHRTPYYHNDSNNVMMMMMTTTNKPGFRDPRNSHQQSASSSSLMHAPSPNFLSFRCDKCDYVCSSQPMLLHHFNMAHGSIYAMQAGYHTRFPPNGLVIPSQAEILDLDSHKVHVYQPPVNGHQRSDTTMAAGVATMTTTTTEQSNNSTLQPSWLQDAAAMNEKKYYNNHHYHHQESEHQENGHRDKRLTTTGATPLASPDFGSVSTTTGDNVENLQQHPIANNQFESGSHFDSSNQSTGSSSSGQPINHITSSDIPRTGKSSSGKAGKSGNTAAFKSNEARRPKTYNCSACNKWFTSSGHLKRHYNTTLHKNAVKQSGAIDPATMPISAHHHPQKDPTCSSTYSSNRQRAKISSPTTTSPTESASCSSSELSGSSTAAALKMNDHSSASTTQPIMQTTNNSFLQHNSPNLMAGPLDIPGGLLHHQSPHHHSYTTTSPHCNMPELIKSPLLPISSGTLPLPPHTSHSNYHLPFTVTPPPMAPFFQQHTQTPLYPNFQSPHVSTTQPVTTNSHHILGSCPTRLTTNVMTISVPLLNKQLIKCEKLSDDEEDDDHQHRNQPSSFSSSLPSFSYIQKNANASDAETTTTRTTTDNNNWSNNGNNHINNINNNNNNGENYGTYLDQQRSSYSGESTLNDGNVGGLLKVDRGEMHKIVEPGNTNNYYFNPNKQSSLSVRSPDMEHSNSSGTDSFDMSPTSSGHTTANRLNHNKDEYNNNNNNYCSTTIDQNCNKTNKNYGQFETDDEQICQIKREPEEIRALDERSSLLLYDDIDSSANGGGCSSMVQDTTPLGEGSLISMYDDDVSSSTIDSSHQMSPHVVTADGHQSSLSVSCKVSSYSCDKCKKAFNRACYLTQHNKSFHSGFKPYKCNRCGKRFTECKQYEDHRDKHAGEKPHKCDICPKQFNHKTDLRRHVCLHTNVRPHTCDLCHKGFIRKDHMLKHRETHVNKRNEPRRIKIQRIKQELELQILC